MEKLMFILAMSGSALFLVQQIGKFVAALFSPQAQAVAKPAAPEDVKDEKKEPTLAAPTGLVERNIALTELLTAQGQQLEKVTLALEQVSARLAALEAPKPRAARKTSSKPQITMPEIDSFPPVDAVANGYDQMPPVNGGFEPVH